MNSERPTPVYSEQLKRSVDVTDLPLRLQRWFSEKITDGKDIEVLSVQRTSGEAGLSADMFIVTLRWTHRSTGEARTEKVILRAEIQAPNNPLSNSRHMIAALQRLSTRTNLPVPKILWVEEDRSVVGGPFCVMEFLHGKVAPDSPPFSAKGWVAEATREQRTRMCRSGVTFLTRLHALDWKPLDMDFMLQSENGLSHTATVVTKAIALYDEAVEGRRGDFEHTVITWLQQNVPAVENLRVSWGDSRPGNMLFDDFELVGALDWEMVTLLNPAYDVGLWLYADYMLTEAAGLERLPGMMMRDELLREYETRAGAALEDFAYFEVLAAFRSYAVMMNMMKTWERGGQPMFGEGVTLENVPPRKAFVFVASRHV